MLICEIRVEKVFVGFVVRNFENPHGQQVAHPTGCGLPSSVVRPLRALRGEEFENTLQAEFSAGIYKVNRLTQDFLRLLGVYISHRFIIRMLPQLKSFQQRPVKTFLNQTAGYLGTPYLIRREQTVSISVKSVSKESSRSLW